MIDGASLPGRVKQNASAVFHKLGEAEAAVHQVPVEKVHFHEVGAIDSIADIVGACLGFELLGVDAISCSALNLGSGTVTGEHGVMPVPAPATAALVAGRPVYSRGPAVELTTPTGAAVAVTLAREFGALPSMKIAGIGERTDQHVSTNARKGVQITDAHSVSGLLAWRPKEFLLSYTRLRQPQLFLILGSPPYGSKSSHHSRARRRHRTGNHGRHAPHHPGRRRAAGY